jgi:hypothetical protein
MGMKLLVQIDLAGAGLALFDAYEAAVLPLLDRYGARIELRLRAVDRQSETHLLYFPDADMLARYRADPDRAAALPLWERSRAQATMIEVVAFE